MSVPTKVSTDGIAVVNGYGVKIFVERGHLVVEDGICDERSRRKFNRSTGRLQRLVVIGHTGFVTLEALRWIRDVGASFIQIDGDATLITSTAHEHASTAKDLRRAQVMAGESGLGQLAMIDLLETKLRGQAEVAERLMRYSPTGRASKATQLTVPEAIRCEADAIRAAESPQEQRQIESTAGRYYWQHLAHLPVRFAPGFEVPDHWRTAGPRTPWRPTGNKRPMNAISPVHAMLNYTYALLEHEATIAAYRMGFDPSLGLLHADKRYRPSLASDLMEPARPIADSLVIDLIEGRDLVRGDVLETRKGICRLGPTLSRELACAILALSAAVAPYAEQLARALLSNPAHPTPLTRRRHRAAIAAQPA